MSPRCITLIHLIVLIAQAARPFATDGAGSVEPDEFEIEAGATGWRSSGSGGAGVKHGITQRMGPDVAFGNSALPRDGRSFSGAEITTSNAWLVGGCDCALEWLSVDLGFSDAFSPAIAPLATAGLTFGF
jgi:hypothetical protein